VTAKATAIICALLAASILGISTLTSRIRAQESAIAALQQETEKLQRPNEESQRLEPIAVDRAEIERLRRETAILLKLRNEVGMYQHSSAEPAELPSAKAEIVAQLLNERERILAEEQEIHQLSDRATCIKNLEAIAAAKARWAADNAAEKGFPVVMERLINYLPPHSAPVCPAGGHYSVNRIGAPPVCSVEGHSIP
jgi:hypothetical protein